MAVPSQSFLFTLNQPGHAYRHIIKVTSRCLHDPAHLQKKIADLKESYELNLVSPWHFLTVAQVASPIGSAAKFREIRPRMYIEDLLL